MASVALPDGVAVQARALSGRRQRQQPGFAVYLCGRRSRRRVAREWTGTWRAIWLDWPPLGLPSDGAAAVAALVEAHMRAARGEPVEIACTSGRSRTGTALAALAVRTGLDADEAVAWVRVAYPPARIVTRRQRRWLAEWASELRRVVPV
jgi:Protein-tyrosine phosphatase